MGRCLINCPEYFIFLKDIFRGDPTYFGDIIIFGLGPLYYTIFSFCRNKLSLILSIPFQIIILTTLIVSYTKGTILSVLIFFIVSIFLLKGKRVFMTLSCILFIVVIITNITYKNIYRFLPTQITPQSEHVVTSQDFSIKSRQITKSKAVLDVLPEDRLTLMGNLLSHIKSVML